MSLKREAEIPLVRVIFFGLFFTSLSGEAGSEPFRTKVWETVAIHIPHYDRENIESSSTTWFSNDNMESPIVRRIE